MLHTRVWLGGLLVLGLSTLSVHADSPLLAKAVKGTPEIKSLQTLTFAPGGVLLIGDGRGQQIWAVETGDTTKAASQVTKVESIDVQIAGRLGVMPGEIEILDLAVNPASGTPYLSARKKGTQKDMLLTVSPAGEVAEVSLQSVSYVRLPLPSDERAPVTLLSDVAWAGDRVLAAGRANDDFSSKMFVIRAPLQHESSGQIYSAETYHVAHGKWETKAPMSTVLAFEDQGRHYCVGAFACTPVVRYGIDDLQPNAHVKGESVLELGSGNRPLDMIVYKKGDKNHVLVNTFRFHHEKRPISPNPYWAAVFSGDLLTESNAINEKALRREGKLATTEQVRMADAYHGVVQLDLLNAEQALVIRQNDAGRFDLEAVALP